MAIVHFEPFLSGKGPTFAVDTDRVTITMSAVGVDTLIFEGEDYQPGVGASGDVSLQAEEIAAFAAHYAECGDEHGFVRDTSAVVAYAEHLIELNVTDIVWG